VRNPRHAIALLARPLRKLFRTASIAHLLSTRNEAHEADMAPKHPLDDFISATADALTLQIDPAWQPAIRTHLEITLGFARLVAEHDLPDDAEPAPVFKA
jgi:hypothetical protein